MMVNEIKNILVPIDFTKNNDKFLQTVAAIAKRHSAKIHLLNVVKTNMLGSGTVFAGKFYYHGNTLLANSENLLDQEKEKLRQLYQVNAETNSVIGSVASAITQFAGEHHIDLIVIGVDYPKKRPGFISSNAYEIITNTFIPVVSVPFNCSKAKFNKMLFPVRDTEDVVSKLQPVLPIAKRNNAKVNLLGLASDSAKNSIITVNNALKFLKVKIAKHNLDCSLQEILITANPEEYILEASESTNADMVVVNVTTEKQLCKIFKNNFTENIIYKSKIPVMFYRKKKSEDALKEFITMPYPMLPI